MRKHLGDFAESLDVHRIKFHRNTIISSAFHIKNPLVFGVILNNAFTIIGQIRIFFRH